MTRGEFPCPHCSELVEVDVVRCPSCESEPLILGDYRIAELLGRGGMSTVYGAVRDRDGQQVAVKMLRLDSEVDWKAYELFERGSKTLKWLKHPSLPKLHAFGRVGESSLVQVLERLDASFRPGIWPSSDQASGCWSRR